MEALSDIIIIVVSTVLGTLFLQALDAVWTGFMNRRHRARMVRMPERIRRINEVC